MAVRMLLSICQVYSWLIIARVIISWLNPRPGNSYLVMICRLTDPLLDLLRPLIPLRGIDLSPILALLLVRLLCTMLARLVI
ncbi:YggT family protein [bacterium]|nr:YggT family protein [bacterium]MBU1072337.1 YggT family protein [bacterium]MBU1675063.1 YggT family protein [bacterium]